MELQPYDIQNKIFEIHGRRIMLDFDLAAMYGVETAQLKRSIRRNIERFEGEDFVFVTTRDELSRCQIGTLNKGRGGNIKYRPFAFTELGIAMLSSVLNSGVAIEVNRRILRAFVAIRELILTHATESAEIAQLRERVQRLEQSTKGNTEAIRTLYTAIDELSNKPSQLDPKRRLIGFKRKEK